VPFPHAIALILIALPAAQEGRPPRDRPPKDAPADDPSSQGAAADDTPRQKAPAEITQDVIRLKKEGAAEASAALTAIEGRLANAWLARRPALARRRGLAPLDLDELRIGPSAHGRWVLELTALRDELDGVQWADLDFVRQGDRGWFRALLDAELRARANRPPERWDPSFYLRELGALLLGVSRAAELSPDRRLAVLTEHLARLPATLADAHVSIGTPPGPAARRGQRYVDQLLTLLDETLTRRLRVGKSDPELWRAYQDARKGARAAVVAFGAWLEVAAQENARFTPLRSDTWSRLVLGATGVKVDVDALKIRVARDIAELDRLASPFRELSLDVEPPPAPTPLPPREVADLARTTLASGWSVAEHLGFARGEMPALWVEPEIATGPPGDPIDATWVVDGKGTARASLAILVGGSNWTPAEKERRTSELTPPALRARVLRFGYPGELLWETWSREHAQVGYRALWNETMRSAWGLFAADVCTRVEPDENPLARDEPLRREVARERLLEAVRCYVALRVHAEGATEAEAAREFSALTELGPELSAQEARETLLDPLRGAAYLGYRELIRLEGELAADADPVFAIRWVGHLTRRAPSAAPNVHSEDWKTVAAELKKAAAAPEEAAGSLEEDR